MTTPKRDLARRSGRARILRGTDGRPVRARRLKEPAGLKVKFLRFGLVLLVFGFFASIWTRPVQQIEVQGVWLSSSSFITAMLEPELGRRWITTPTRAFEEQIARDPWIDQVQVMRAPGSRLIVRVREAEPVFCMNLGEGRRLLDRDGDLLPECTDLFVESLPVVRGLEVEDGRLSQESLDHYVSLLRALDETGWIWSQGLALLDLGDPREVVLRSRDEVEVVVSMGEAHDQLGDANQVWHQLDTEGPTRVDLRFGNQIVLSR
jgi:cell division septal protein FtsQ